VEEREKVEAYISRKRRRERKQIGKKKITWGRRVKE